MKLLQIMRRQALLARKDLERLNEAEMNSGMEIPHRQVRLEAGVLHAERVETEFVKAMNHELRTSLNVIIGLCQFLKRDARRRSNQPKSMPLIAWSATRGPCC